MSLFTQNSLLLKHRSEKKHLKFHMDELPLILWEEVIDCINFNVENNLSFKTLSRFGIVLHDTSTMLKVSDILESFKNIDTSVPASAHCYISLSASSQTFGWHKDTSDVIFWQVLGKTLFAVKDAGETVTYTLETNDLLYVPKGMMHNTSPITPRVGISFGLDYSSN